MHIIENGFNYVYLANSRLSYAEFFNFIVPRELDFGS